MVIQPITYKQVLDKEGDFEAIELWQGDQHIIISLEAHGLHKNGYRWSEVKEIIDHLTEQIHYLTIKGLEKSGYKFHE